MLQTNFLIKLSHFQALQICLVTSFGSFPNFQFHSSGSTPVSNLPLNSGFYRMISIKAEKNSVVSAEWPTAVTGFLMPYEKIMNSIFEMWSSVSF